MATIRADVRSINYLEKSNTYGVTLKAFEINGQKLPEPIWIDEKMSKDRLDRYYAQGFNKNAVVTFECVDINAESHRELPATATLPAQPLHELIGPMTNLVVQRAVRPMGFAAAADSAHESSKTGLLDTVMGKIGLARTGGEKQPAAKRTRAKAK